MRDLAKTEEGFSLTELLVAMLLIAVVMMTTFAALNRFGNATRQNFEPERGAEHRAVGRRPTGA